MFFEKIDHDKVILKNYIKYFYAQTHANNWLRDIFNYIHKPNLKLKIVKITAW